MIILLIIYVGLLKNHISTYCSVISFNNILQYSAKKVTPTNNC